MKSGKQLPPVCCIRQRISAELVLYKIIEKNPNKALTSIYNMCYNIMRGCERTV